MSPHERERREALDVEVRLQVSLDLFISTVHRAPYLKNLYGTVLYPSLPQINLCTLNILVAVRVWRPRRPFVISDRAPQTLKLLHVERGHLHAEPTCSSIATANNRTRANGYVVRVRQQRCPSSNKPGHFRVHSATHCVHFKPVATSSPWPQPPPSPPSRPPPHHLYHLYP